MNWKRLTALALIAVFSISANAEVVHFCERYLAVTDRPYEMRCIADRSPFANSVRIINNEDQDGGESAAFFVGRKADNRTMSGALHSEMTPAGRAILFKATDQLYIFEVYVLMRGDTMVDAFWKVTDRKLDKELEKTKIHCYGSLWQFAE